MLQFLLAGALVVAWIWMLGRPLLAMLARRSRRDSVGHFRYQQAALSQTVGTQPAPGVASTLFRPVLDWRAQPLEQRRLQILLGGGLATFASALLAIALRGSYIGLFLIMTAGFSAHLLVAAWIGSRELRQRDAELRRMTIDAATERSAGRAVAATRHRDDVRTGERSMTADHRRSDDDMTDLLDGDGLGGGLFDEGFFEPIPELDQLSGNRSVARTPAAPDLDVTEDEDEAGTDAAADDGGIDQAPAASDDEVEPTFTAPVTPRPRPGRRPKGRPIYIEGEPDEGDGTVRAVND